MDLLIDLSWRAYPAGALMAFGAALTMWGTKLEVDGWRRSKYDLDKVLTIVRGFRFFIIGLAVVGLGAAWVWHLVWLLVLSLVIGGEEMLETSIMIYALRRGKRLEADCAPSKRVD